jgi:hypothetical protein
VAGIEPAPIGWKPSVLPLNTTRAWRADDEIRTRDPFLTKEVLYRWSYVGLSGPCWNRTSDLQVVTLALSLLS